VYQRVVLSLCRVKLCCAPNDDRSFLVLGLFESCDGRCQWFGGPVFDEFIDLLFFVSVSRRQWMVVVGVYLFGQGDLLLLLRRVCRRDQIVDGKEEQEQLHG